MRQLLILIIVLIVNPVFSQEDSLNEIQPDSIELHDTIFEPEVIIDPLQSVPIFPGGNDSLWCIIEKNLNFKTLNNIKGIGNIFIRFEIDTLGKAENITINPDHLRKRKIIIDDTTINKEITRVIQLLPKWTPAKIGNRKVRCGFMIPINVPYTEFKCPKIYNPTSIYWNVDKKAEFKYGTGTSTKESIEEFIGKNGIWPSQDDCQGIVFVRCLIDKKGKLSDYLILRGLGDCRGFDEEAMRLVKLMPKWEPALVNEKPVKSYRIIPIPFVLK